MAVDVTGLLTAVIDAAPRIADDAGHAMDRDIALSTPIGDTGDLSRSGIVQTTATGDGASVTLTYDEEYASFVDQGRGPIQGNPLLAFHIGGQLVIVHSVGPAAATNFFSDKAEDESLWTLLCQASADATVIT